MKHLLTVILSILALVAVVTGCGGAHRYDARLVRADSLMRPDPDSALAIVQAVVRDSLTSDGDRAYRDLLLTQARYRCYITATSDSDINRALCYYRAHSGEREKLTRAYIYKGAVMEELGHPDSAMLYYKTAEATAAPDDYFNLGYTNLRIAELYQGIYINDSATIARMKIATHYFMIINDTSFLIITIGGQGSVFYGSENDSAKQYLEQAISLAKAVNSTKRFNYQSKLAGYYFYKEDYSKAKNLAMDIIRYGVNECDEDQFYYYAARSFIKSSQLDSTYYVKSMIPPPTTSLDSFNYYTLAAELANAEQRYHDYAAYLAESKRIYDRIYSNSLTSNVGEVEIKFDADKQKEEYKKSMFSNVMYVSGIAVLMVSFLVFLLIKRIKRRISKYQDDIDLSRVELEKTIKIYEEKLAENKLSLSKQNELLAEKDKMIKRVTKENDKLLSQQSIDAG